jgi:hypothetical protein
MSSFSNALLKVLEGVGMGLSKGLPEKVEIQINIGNGNQKIEFKDNTVSIPVPPDDPQNIIEMITKEFIEKAPADSRFVDSEMNNLIEISEDSISDKNEDLEYFKKLLRKEDIAILKAAIVIKEVSQRGNSVSNLKNLLCERYGSRAGVIANLYSAGYFASVFKPLNTELEKAPEYSIDMFRSKFDSLVEDFPMAIFVSQGMSTESLKEEIIKKALYTRKYGIYSFNIHAIGKKNIQTVNSAINSLIKDEKVSKEQFLFQENEGDTIKVIFLYENWINNNS